MYYRFLFATLYLTIESGLANVETGTNYSSKLANICVEIGKVILTNSAKRHQEQIVRSCDMLI